MMQDVMTELSRRITDAAHLAVLCHLRSLRLESSQQPASIGGADHGRITDETLLKTTDPSVDAGGGAV